VDFRGTDIRIIPVPTFHVCGKVIVEGAPPPPPAPRGGAPANLPSPPPPPPPPIVGPGAPAGDIGPGVLNLRTGIRIDDVCPSQSPGPPLPNQSMSPIRLSAVGTRAEVSNSSGNTYSSPVDPSTGRFVIRNVVPGIYDLSTTIAGMNGRIPLEVRDNVENVT